MAKKEIGGRSSQQNDFLEPSKPTINSAVNVGTSRVFDDGAITVTFSLPVNSPPATSYTVTATASGQTTRTATGSSSPLTVVGLKSAISYSVTVVASNAAGSSAASDAASATVTTVPAKPSAPTVTTQVNQDNVSWSAPATGGVAISNYQWESNDAKGNTTTATSVAVAQEGGTAQAYRVRAYNTNGWGEWSDWSGTITTTPPFFPYFPPYFPPFFPFFPFFPYFPPYFPPFFPYFPFFPFFPYFPPRFPYFPPRFPYFPPYFRAGCIEANTMVMTINGLVAAKDLNVGDKVLSFVLDEKQQESDAGVLFMWDSESITISDKEPVETEIIRIIEKGDSAVIYFNGNTESKYSITQPVFVRSEDVYKIRTTGSLEVGDFIVNVDGSGNISEEEIVDITIEEDLGTVFQIDCEPYQWFIAGGYLVHNK